MSNFYLNWRRCYGGGVDWEVFMWYSLPLSLWLDVYTSAYDCHLFVKCLVFSSWLKQYLYHYSTLWDCCCWKNMGIHFTYYHFNVWMDFSDCCKGFTVHSLWAVADIVLCMNMYYSSCCISLWILYTYIF